MLKWEPMKTNLWLPLCLAVCQQQLEMRVEQKWEYWVLEHPALSRQENLLGAVEVYMLCRGQKVTENNCKDKDKEDLITQIGRRV